ncbi:MAG: alginate lyase family protein [Intrasporangium sp.]|uniref:heparinase II/III family protein n=1 Tax=Intrasporangium sp. TaxID=1925024 RepID=UPI003F819DAA
MSRSASWYFRRLRRMPPSEIAARVTDRARQLAWARRQVTIGDAESPIPGLLQNRTFVATFPEGSEPQVRGPDRDALITAADRLLAGEWTVLGRRRPDIASPDWFLDPVTGRSAPSSLYAFHIDHRDENVTGNVKSVWELSRHHHLTLLAAAWRLTGDDRYAEAVAEQLSSWWALNPFLSGVHWTSGIELGIRLTSWVWVRRLLDGWPGAPALFEANPAALRQIRWHQEYLAAFRSRGSSANNHLVAEACGRLVAACAFPWYAESERWRREAAAELEQGLAANTFPSGVNRELATDYHRFVTELGLLALVEADLAQHRLSRSTDYLLACSLDAAAALLDGAGRAPRQGDGDEGRGILLDPPDLDPWTTLLSTGAAVFGAMAWWPRTEPRIASHFIGALATRPRVSGRATEAPRTFPDAGIHLLRSASRDGPELWCRCDGGPHGFLSIAAHGHADALSVEVRHGSVDVFADPGTYCYHGEPEWRSYFRSTRAHNTVEVDGTSQSVEGGPFLWSTHTDGVIDQTNGHPTGIQAWSAHHTGYARLDPALRHSRQVILDAEAEELSVVDVLQGSRPHSARLAWHLGPQVSATLCGTVAHLSWPCPRGVQHALVRLPDGLEWAAFRGETTPIIGWYSPEFGKRVPSTTLLGTGTWTGTLTLRTLLQLCPADDASAARARTPVEAASGELFLGHRRPHPGEGP